MPKYRVCNVKSRIIKTFVLFQEKPIKKKFTIRNQDYIFKAWFFQIALSCEDKKNVNLKLNKKPKHWSLHPIDKTWSTWKKKWEKQQFYSSGKQRIFHFELSSRHPLYDKRGTSEKPQQMLCLDLLNHIQPQILISDLSFFGYYLNAKD